jgi:hypothetical protein
VKSHEKHYNSIVERFKAACCVCIVHVDFIKVFKVLHNLRIDRKASNELGFCYNKSVPTEQNG